MSFGLYHKYLAVWVGGVITNLHPDILAPVLAAQSVMDRLAEEALTLTGNLDAPLD